jgi:cytochrome c peroxidase
MYFLRKITPRRTSQVQDRLYSHITIVVAMCALVLSRPGDAHGSDVPLGLPPVPQAAVNAQSAAKIALGRKIFFGKRLSGDGNISCAGCHQPERAFTDGLTVARGIGHRSGTRNTPSLLNVAYNQSQFWDGRRPDLEAQALDPFINPREHGFLYSDSLINILRRDAGYRAAFRQAFPGSRNAVSIDHVVKSLASFERTLLAGNSAFDRYFFKSDKAALSPAAVRGLALFQGAARCTTCQIIGQTHALFSDNQFHSLSIGLQRLGPRLADITTRLARARSAGASLDQKVLSDDDIAQLGRFAVTLDPAHVAKFRTPSLRNVAQTAPYMHDGSVATLEDAVELELYYRSVQMDRPIILTPTEKADLIDFLRSLSSSPLFR